MDETWLDRDWVVANVTGVNFRELTYVPGAGLYYVGQEPFTGVSLTWASEGWLRGISHFLNGLEHGVAVGWYRDGQPRVYNDMSEGVCHGWHIEWAPDGALRAEVFCERGQPQRRKRE